jgi:hypothetical protein
MSQFPPPQPVIIASTKNVGVSILLTFFFGPLGMLYSTVLGGIIMIVVTVLVFFITFGFGTFLTWPICVIWGALAAHNYNKRLLSRAGL